MCGIWGYFQKTLMKDEVWKLYRAFEKVKNRGPDRSEFITVNDFVDFYVGFHRLSIMDVTVKGDQPFKYDVNGHSVYCVCNGEIYNFQKIKDKYDLRTKSGSDCEVIPLLYLLHGHDTVLKEIHGEFAYLIIDLDHVTNTLTIFSSVDPTSVRPLFYAENNHAVGFSSELKGLVGLFAGKDIKRFPPGSSMKIVISKENFSLDIVPYYFFDYTTKITNLEEARAMIKHTFIECVKDKLLSDRPLGCLLSGGLDSSLVASVASQELQKHGKQLKTFSIGMPGATDEKYAKMVAKHINSEHKHFEISQKDFLDAIDQVVYATETFDITTIRASTGQYLVSKLVSQYTDIKVLLIGDGSDELCSGYMYFHEAPTPEESHQENVRLVRDICFYDSLRADRGISHNGLEARVPFLDQRFIDLYMSIDPKLRIPTNGIEKWLLRSSFEGYLPEEVLWRVKEAFSDGVSSVKKSWYEIIQDRAESMYCGEEFKRQQERIKHCSPPNKEALYFRDMFEKLFGNDDVCHVIPYFWLPKWCGNISEPSARVLKSYSSKKNMDASKKHVQ